ncbi:Crp/Fnr family transcriptional regulator [Xanthovirga aplysinae]|uniref:Crp/Fnr family transcriptional regulator n=1 Tax=Xanthovirga aplysinae TaxID=2529853 RepID=UPI0012BC8BC5|nr:Crp/Fnr family transcriptional regulator [Xanthovirga aplysinae]MTI29839.1 Crp/Fnr family transcriptional regulator [Xanthovirga aplysinae]
MIAIKERIKALYPLSEKSMDLLTAIMHKEVHQKGYLLFEAGERSKKIYFLEKGAARAFHYKNDKEVTFWFGFEGDIALSYYAYFAGKPGYETIELLEDATLYVMNWDDLQSLFLQHIEIANWGRKLAENELINTEERFISHQFFSAKERYLSLINNYSDITQRVLLGHIASYLGITQVTLSRIRAGFGKK